MDKRKKVMWRKGKWKNMQAVHVVHIEIEKGKKSNAVKQLLWRSKQWDEG